MKRMRRPPLLRTKSDLVCILFHVGVRLFALNLHENQISKHARYPDMLDIRVDTRARTTKDRC